MEQRLRIALCNLQLGVGTTRGYWHYLTTAWKYALPHGPRPIARAAEGLRAEGVELAALCEVSGGAWRSRQVDHVALIAREAELPHHAFFPTFVVEGRLNQGNAVCSRHAVRAVANHPLPGPGEPRFLSEAEVDVGGVPVRVLVTHLSLHREVRAPQLTRILEVVDRSDGPTILAGDFNAPKPVELTLLAESHLQQAASAATFPSWKPTRALDHLFVSDHFRIEAHGVFDRFRFSDHLPLVTTLTLKRPDRPSGQ